LSTSRALSITKSLATSPPSGEKLTAIKSFDLSTKQTLIVPRLRGWVSAMAISTSRVVHENENPLQPFDLMPSSPPMKAQTEAEMAGSVSTFSLSGRFAFKKFPKLSD
jgi:hypothetical protein